MRLWSEFTLLPPAPLTPNVPSESERMQKPSSGNLEKCTARAKGGGEGIHNEKDLQVDCLQKWSGEDVLGDLKKVLAPGKLDVEVTSLGALSEL